MSPVRIAVIVGAALVGSVGLALFARSIASPPRPKVETSPAPDNALLPIHLTGTRASVSVRDEA